MDLTIKNIKKHLVNVVISIFWKLVVELGKNLKKIKELFNVPDAIGIEISAEAVKKLNERGIKGIVADVNRDSLPLDDNTIDIVLFQEVIEHLYNSDLIMTEIRRVLKPKGLLILSTPNLASWTNRVALLFGFNPFLMMSRLLAALGE
jgi:SAM-dependent methyltransferase